MSYKSLTQAERIASLEVEVVELKNTVKALDSKIDELLTLKAKGSGALWLLTLVFGAGIMSGAAGLVDWIKGW